MNKICKAQSVVVFNHPGGEQGEVCVGFVGQSVKDGVKGHPLKCWKSLRVGDNQTASEMYPAFAKKEEILDLGFDLITEPGNFIERSAKKIPDTSDKSEYPEIISDKDFEKRVVEFQGNAMVMFFATWCAPCRVMHAGIVSGKRYFDVQKLDVYRSNVDDYPGVCGKYGIRGIPTVVFFKDGQVVDQVVGAMPEAQLYNFVDKCLSE